MNLTELEKVYTQSMKAVRDLIEDIRFGRNLYLEPVIDCAWKIKQNLINNSNYILHLHKMGYQDNYLKTHSVNVAFISSIIGQWLNLNDTDLINLTCAGLLHDMGKAKVKDSLLNKRGRLSEEELKLIKVHPHNGYKMLERLQVIDRSVLMGVLTHHERINGSGYPAKLKGKDIHLFGKVIAIADIFDAMATNRPYKLKNLPFKIFEEIASESFGYLDPNICQVFIENMIKFSSGATVRLSNEKVGEVVYISPGAIARPIIRSGEEYINLEIFNELEIIEIL